MAVMIKDITNRLGLSVGAISRAPSHYTDFPSRFSGSCLPNPHVVLQLTLLIRASTGNQA